jgi:hypothetical protein
MLFCQIVATLVATRHPKAATVERTVARRGRGTIYVDYLQNILGKTLATAYSARASDYAGVSTPLTWKEVDGGVDPRDFTIRTAPARFREVGDLWKAGLRDASPQTSSRSSQKYQSRLEGRCPPPRPRPLRRDLRCRRTRIVSRRACRDLVIVAAVDDLACVDAGRRVR